MSRGHWKQGRTGVATGTSAALHSPERHPIYSFSIRKKRMKCGSSIPAYQGSAWKTGICLTWLGADGEPAYFGCLGILRTKERVAPCCSSTREPGVPQTDTTGSKRLQVPEEETYRFLWLGNTQIQARKIAFCKKGFRGSQNIMSS